MRFMATMYYFIMISLLKKYCELVIQLTTGGLCQPSVTLTTPSMPSLMLMP